MDSRQRYVIWVGTLLIVVLGLAPPWRFVENHRTTAALGCGYGWIFAPPHYKQKLEAPAREVREYVAAALNLNESSFDSSSGNYRPGSFTTVNRFEERYDDYSLFFQRGDYDRVLSRLDYHGNVVFCVLPWGRVCPRLDVARLQAELAVVVLATVGVVLGLGNRGKQPGV